MADLASTDIQAGPPVAAGRQPLLLPQRARLLHIGLKKTGTTSLQHAASTLRPELLERGVRYPGTSLNHRKAVLAFMDRSWGWGEKPSTDEWFALRDEIEADTSNRIWIGHEFVAESTDEVAVRFREALGERAHVVVTVRNYASALASNWQQSMKGGQTRPFVSWLKDVLADEPNGSGAQRFVGANDHGAIVRRWADAFGAENVTVVVVDKSTPTALFDAFENMLGLDHGVLNSAPADGYSSNRGMSVEESELLRALNKELRGSLSWNAYMRWVRVATAGTMLRERQPGEHDTPFVLPVWAERRARARARGYVEQVEASGVRVVGDLSLVAQRVPSVKGPRLASDSVPIDAAVQALLGLLEAGRSERRRARRAAGTSSEQASRVVPADPAIDEFSARELFSELAARGRRRLHLGGR